MREAPQVAAIAPIGLIVRLLFHDSQNQSRGTCVSRETVAGNAAAQPAGRV
jgi:hypothetical protein